MRPLFNVPGEGAFALIMGIISGYPVGAKIVTTLYEKKICNKEESERLLAFTNNSGPLFIIGTVGISLLGDSTIGIILLSIHVLASLTVGLLFHFWKYNKPLSHRETPIYNTNNVNFSNLGEILGTSITNSINTIMMIGGYVVLFSVIISILENCGIFNLLVILIQPFLKIFNIPQELFTSIISGFIELTNGLKTISSIPIKNYTTTIIISSMLLGFGGISILLQVFSIISKTNISIKPYIIGKILHAIFSTIYIFIFFNIFTQFSLNI